MNNATDKRTIMVTGAFGLIGRAACEYYLKRGYHVVAIDNDARATFFGMEASTLSSAAYLKDTYGSAVTLLDVDITDGGQVRAAYRNHRYTLYATIHAAAQPSHDWAGLSDHNMIVDFETNARGTLNVLQAHHEVAPKKPFVHVSTNKVYGDYPNRFDYVKDGKRFTPDFDVYGGMRDCIEYPLFDESDPTDKVQHSFFGVSKLAADMYAQEFGYAYKMPVAVFRGGCLTGENHAGAQAHGFLNYLVKCAVHGKPYTVFGYDGYQVRDNIHADDVIAAFDEYIQDPCQTAMVFNIGGGPKNSLSILEAVDKLAERGLNLDLTFDPTPRRGDHKYWVTDMTKFEIHYPSWKVRIGIDEIIDRIIAKEKAHAL